MDALIRRYTGFVRLKASSLLPRRRRQRRPPPGRADRPLQGGARLPRRQGDLVPQLRRALRDPADHHGDQDGDALQARAAQHVRLVQPHAPPARTATASARSATRCPGPAVHEPPLVVISTRGAAEPRLQPRHRPLAARGGRAAPLSRGLVVRGDGRAARLRHEDDRQRAPACEAEDHHAPEGARGRPLNRPLRCAGARAGVAQLVEQTPCKR